MPGDGVVLWEEPEMRPATLLLGVDIVLNGVKCLELVVEDSSCLNAPDLVI